jgi:hypothetical protein
MTYAEHQAEHAAELQRIRDAADRARLWRAAAAYALAEGPPVPEAAPRRHAPRTQQPAPLTATA